MDTRTGIVSSDPEQAARELKIGETVLDLFSRQNPDKPVYLLACNKRADGTYLVELRVGREGEPGTILHRGYVVVD